MLPEIELLEHHGGSWRGSGRPAACRPAPARRGASASRSSSAAPRAAVRGLEQDAAQEGRRPDPDEPRIATTSCVSRAVSEMPSGPRGCRRSADRAHPRAPPDFRCRGRSCPFCRHRHPFLVSARRPSQSAHRCRHPMPCAACIAFLSWRQLIAKPRRCPSSKSRYCPNLRPQTHGRRWFGQSRIHPRAEPARMAHPRRRANRTEHRHKARIAPHTSWIY